jgi:chorismate synthase
MLRYLTAGESHGRALGVIVEGLPAGLEVTVEDVSAELARRRLGFGRGPRQRFERDELSLVGGVRHGRTLGGPVLIEVPNPEWPKWEQEMSPAPGEPGKRLTAPRPGHADLAAMQKYGYDDARDALERASARETAARVAAGALAKLLLRRIGVEIVSHVVAMGGVSAPAGVRPTPADLEAVDASPVRCFDPAASEAMVAAIKAAAKQGDSVGGIVEVVAYGVPVGLGSHVHWDRKLDALLAFALMSIQAVKAVEIGDGWDVAGRLGSEAHDPISWDAEAGAYRRASSLAGGIEGGISTGTKESALSFKERTDVTAVPAMGVVAETMTAIVLAGEALRKFGGDSVPELERNVAAYIATL